LSSFFALLFNVTLLRCFLRSQKEVQASKTFFLKRKMDAIASTKIRRQPLGWFDKTNLQVSSRKGLLICTSNL